MRSTIGGGGSFVFPFIKCSLTGSDLVVRLIIENLVGGVIDGRQKWGAKDFMTLLRAEENVLRSLRIVRGYKNSEREGWQKIQRFAGAI